MARIFHPPPARIQGLPLLQGLVRFSPPPSPGRSATQTMAVCIALFSPAALLYAQTPPPGGPPAGSIVIPGADLPIELNLRLETKTERDRNLKCNSLEAAQVSVLS